MARTKRKGFPLVMITWNDAYSDDGWTTREKLLEDPTATQRVKSVGWLVAETPENYYLASSVPFCDDADEKEHEYANTMIIPVGFVIERKVLRRG